MYNWQVVVKKWNKDSGILSQNGSLKSNRGRFVCAGSLNQADLVEAVLTSTGSSKGSFFGEVKMLHLGDGIPPHVSLFHWILSSAKSNMFYGTPSIVHVADVAFPKRVPSRIKSKCSPVLFALVEWIIYLTPADMNENEIQLLVAPLFSLVPPIEPLQLLACLLKYI